MQKRLYSTEEIAEQFGVRPPTVRAWRAYLDVPAIAIGRLVKYDADAVMTWIRSGGPNALAAAMRAAAERRRRERETAGVPVDQPRWKGRAPRTPKSRQRRAASGRRAGVIT